MSNFDIEIRTSGCFHGSQEYFSVDKKKNGYLLKSKRTGKSHLVEIKKIDALKNYLKMKIGKEDFGGCTSSEYIRIGTLFNSIDYEHNHCSGIEATMINDLLNYYELVSDDQTD